MHSLCAAGTRLVIYIGAVNQRLLLVETCIRQVTCSTSTLRNPKCLGMTLTTCFFAYEQARVASQDACNSLCLTCNSE